MLLELPRFKHINVTLIEEESPSSKIWGKAKVIAGGTDLLALMKDRVMDPR